MPRQRHPEILACTPRPHSESPSGGQSHSVSTKDTQRAELQLQDCTSLDLIRKYCQYWCGNRVGATNCEHTEGMPDSQAQTP